MFTLCTLSAPRIAPLWRWTRVWNCSEPQFPWEDLSGKAVAFSASAENSFQIYIPYKIQLSIFFKYASLSPSKCSFCCSSDVEPWIWSRDNHDQITRTWWLWVGLLFQICCFSFIGVILIFSTAITSRQLLSHAGHLNSIFPLICMDSLTAWHQQDVLAKNFFSWTPRLQCGSFIAIAGIEICFFQFPTFPQNRGAGGEWLCLSKHWDKIKLRKKC